ncbi:MAG: hypothetical protein ACOVOL_02435, partial [Bacteroidia bacterium]
CEKYRVINVSDDLILNRPCASERAYSFSPNRTTAPEIGSKLALLMIFPNQRFWALAEKC